MFHHQKLKCYQMALGVAKRVPTLAAAWPRGSSDLADQCRRAIASVILNIAEGNLREFPKERRRFFNIATASAAEVSAAMDLAMALQWINQQDHQEITDHLVQIAKMVCKLP